MNDGNNSLDLLALTKEQKKEILKVVNEADAESGKKLEAAMKETESSDYKDITVQNDNSELVGIDTTINETESDYHEIFDEYNLSNEDATVLLSLIEKYNNNVEMNYYEAMPEAIKIMADGIRQATNIQGVKCGKNDSAKFILKEMVHDAKITNAFNTFSDELNKSVVEMNEEYAKILTDAFDEAFANIDKIEAENPEQAEKIKRVKAAFDEATTFSRQLEYVNKVTANKLNKLVKRYSNETAYFNNLVNVTDVKIPDIRKLLNIIHDNLPEYSIDDIKKFIIAICKSCQNINMDDIAELAYVYKMINNIYECTFIDKNNKTEKSNLIFGNIAKVITSIINK